MGAYVSLLEYDNKEGMILLSELSRRRIRSIAKLIKVGRQEPVMVMRVDEEKGYIDLSKRRVSPEEALAAEEKYAKSRLVNTIMSHVAHVARRDLLKLNQTVTWPLYKKFGHCYDAFRQAATDPDGVLGEFNLDDELKEILVKNIKQRLKPNPHKVRADVEMKCYSFSGVEAIREAMRAAQACSTEECPVEMKLIAAPLYVLTTMTHNKKEGIDTLNRAVDAAQAAISKAEHKGELTVKDKPRVVSAEDERILAEKMAELELANAEVDGDEDNSDTEEEGMSFNENATPGAE